MINIQWRTVGVRSRSFQIGYNPVSVAEFEQFCRSTGYITTAEKEGASDIYRANEELSSPSDPVCYVSPLDALAFCQWSNTRLPTDDEWLAAAVQPHDAVDAKQYFGAVQELRRSQEWKRVTFNTSEIVILENAGFGARHGPKYVRCSSDQNRRLLFPITESLYCLDVGFRVARAAAL